MISRDRPAAASEGRRYLRLRCFGGFRLEPDGVPVDWSGVRPRIRTLMRYLAAEAGQPVHRERITAALWPELPDRAAVNNLHVGVSTLRTFLEPGVARGASRFIVRDGSSYRLDVGAGGVCDVSAFEAALAAVRRARSTGEDAAAVAALRGALDHYTGDLLPEEGPAEWVLAGRDRHRTRATEAAVLLARLELNRGRARAAATAARRALELDGYHDYGWRLLVAAQRRAGDVAASQRSQQTYERMLRSLGVARPADTRPVHVTAA
ncbi:BTAD domain-containing putative transcriptional regulator [Micromonospora olivasterospora]|uniref:DNA-binding SARP family transcriptional activator n=1 Tax=Micromonospora olivasterospora TaxID=1880 RepID=A0A562I2U9_MICOL|nr:BTAD domain-containing putative transcriptional regulator [Micromonospora olivasterospora]TWH65379.1 DNA-binding SARP family transcriptional activator [Micromonospora olivasterospora]